MTATRDKPAPRPGQVWAVPEVVLAMLADTATVTGVRGGFVHFTCAGSGVAARLPVPVFLTLYEPGAP